MGYRIAREVLVTMKTLVTNNCMSVVPLGLKDQFVWPAIM